MKSSRLLFIAQLLLVILAIGLMVPAVLLFLGGLLGLGGILADVGPSENRQMGLQMMGLSLLCFVPAAGAFVLAALLYRISRRK